MDGVKYHVTVVSGNSGVKSNSGDILDNDKLWSFWTAPNLAITESFTDQRGDACRPGMSPCAGLAMDVYQSSLNADLKGDKRTVVRTFLRWKAHMNVNANEQKTNADFMIEWTYGLNSIGSSFERVVRQDQHSAVFRRLGLNSVDKYHTPTSAGSHQVTVRPWPQNNDVPIEYTATKTISFSGRAETLNVDSYQHIDVGDVIHESWQNYVDQGLRVTQQMFPLRSISQTRQGIFTPRFTLTGNMTTGRGRCGQVREVNCDDRFVDTEENCVIRQLIQLKGASLIAAHFPASLCPDNPDVWAAAIPGQLLWFYEGSNSPVMTVSHEVGHVYTLLHPTTTTALDNSLIEGFQIISNNAGSVKSVYENDQIASVMKQGAKPTANTWIREPDFNTLLDQSFSRRRQLQGSTMDFFLVSGLVSSGNVSFFPAFFQSVTLAFPPIPSGDCSVQLQRSNGSVLDQTFVNIGLQVRDNSADGTELVSTSGNLFFTYLSWDPTASQVVVDCGSSGSATLSKSSNEPTVSLSQPSSGAVIGGEQTISWIGSDVDGDALWYQVQLSVDVGVTWISLSPLVTDISFQFDSTLFPNSQDVQIRILVTDGFNVVFDVVDSLGISNPVLLESSLPTDGQLDQPVLGDIRAKFSSPMLPESITSNSITLEDVFGGPTEFAEVEYDQATRTAILSPIEPLQPATTYRVLLGRLFGPTPVGVNGEMFSPTSWTFTTEADTILPSVVATFPAGGETGVPVNSNIQIEFDDDMDATTLNDSTVTLVQTATGMLVQAAINYSNRRALLLPQQDLLDDTTYELAIGEGGGITDTAGNVLIRELSVTFTTGEFNVNPVRIVGNFRDRPVDNDGDGSFEALEILVDVEVTFGGTSNLNGRLLNRDGDLIEWSSTGDVFLSQGYHTLSLFFNSVPIRSTGLDGPYILDSLNFYQGNSFEVLFDVFRTFPYTLASFTSDLEFGPIPDKVFKAGETSYPTFDLRSATSHATQPVDTILYDISINTDPRIGINIDDTTGTLSFLPTTIDEIQSDVTITAFDSTGNRVDSRFSVSFENVRPSRLAATYPATIESGLTETFVLRVYDQFDVLFTSAPTKVELRATDGTLSPSSITTTNGTATFDYTAGIMPGTVFITAEVDGFDTEAVFDIEVLAPSPSCLVSGVGSLDLRKKKSIRWDLSNMVGTSDVATLDSMDITWPAERGNITKIKLGKRKILNNVALIPPRVNISEPTLKPKKARLLPGETKEMKIKFRGGQVTSSSDSFDQYMIEAQFEEGCSTSFAPVAQEVLAEGKLSISDNKVRWKLTNTGTDPLVIANLAVMWPASNGALREIKFKGRIAKLRAAPASAFLPSFDSEAETLTLKPGRSESVQFKFDNMADMSDPTKYMVVLTFVGGLATSFPPPTATSNIV